MSSKDRFRTLYNVVRTWQRGTNRVLAREIRDKDVRDSLALEQSLAGSTTYAPPNIVAEVSFLLHGRFVDMNVGRGRGLGETRKSNKRILKKQRWYSPAWYGRLNKLQGAIGFRIMDDVEEIMKQYERG